MNTEDYAQLSPDTVLNAVESLGLLSDGRSLALNSYENRVYQVGIEEAQPVIAKFYRPNRWSDAQILEEHALCVELAEAEISVVAPLVFEGKTLFEYQGYRFSLYPRQGGREPNLDNPDQLLQLGRCLGRIHAIGASKAFEYRPAITTENYGHECIAFLSEHFVPKDLLAPYQTLCKDLMQTVDEMMQQDFAKHRIRSHSDCHAGNLLWRDDTPHFVDFDDARMAPAVQDIWLLLNGEKHEQELQLCELLEGYSEFYDFDVKQLQLIEALRSLRMIHYAAWLGRRWQDPAFPRAFPWFNSARFWGEHILELREQMAALQEPSLRWL